MTDSSSGAIAPGSRERLLRLLPFGLAVAGAVTAYIAFALLDAFWAMGLAFVFGTFTGMAIGATEQPPVEPMKPHRRSRDERGRVRGVDAKQQAQFDANWAKFDRETGEMFERHRARREELRALYPGSMKTEVVVDASGNELWRRQVPLNPEASND